MDGTLLHLQRNSVYAQIIACIARQAMISGRASSGNKKRKADLYIADGAITHVCHLSFKGACDFLEIVLRRQAHLATQVCNMPLRAYF